MTTNHAVQLFCTRVRWKHLATRIGWIESEAERNGYLNSQSSPKLKDREDTAEDAFVFHIEKPAKFNSLPANSLKSSRCTSKERFGLRCATSFAAVSVGLRHV